MEPNTSTSTSTESGAGQCIGRTILSVLALIAEIHVVLFNVFWIVIETTYRLIVPIPEKSVKGEIVLITGAGHGIGRELSLLYASENATVVCWDINEKNNQDTVQTIAKLGYTKAHAYTCDVSNYNMVVELCEKIRTEIGEISILINNAGIMPAHSFLEHTKEEVERIMQVNLMSHIWTLKAVLPTMITNNYGHVVAISSLCGVEGMTNLVPYCASKFAVRGLMGALRKELGADEKCQIKTTTIYPYIIDTGLAKKVAIRFPSLNPILKKGEVAKSIMSAQRRDVIETTIPGNLFNVFNTIKMLPYKAEKCLIDFMHITVESDL